MSKEDIESIRASVKKNSRQKTIAIPFKEEEPVEGKEAVFVPSNKQIAVFDEIAYTQNDVVVKSTAGSGKTTTIVQAVKYIPYGKSVCFIAFNRHTVDELRERLPPTTNATTMHSLGMQAIRTVVKQLVIQENKQIKFLEKYFAKIESGRERWSMILTADNVMKLVRATMTPRNEADINKMAGNYNLCPSAAEVNAVIRALRDMEDYNQTSKYNLSIDFQDMIELCVKSSWVRMPQYDYVLMDECQDASKLDQLFIDKVIKRGTGRLIAVGDPNQSIYSFRGADVRSFDAFTSRPNTTLLPLDVSYRCSKAIVRHAQKVYPDIHEHPGNKEGLVIEKASDLSMVSDGDMVLCRNLKPLIRAYFQLLKMGKKCMIYGREIEKGLLDYLSRYSDMEVVDALAFMDKHLQKLDGELKAKGFINTENHPKRIALEERIEVITLLSEGYQYMYEVETRVMEIFDDATASIKLMTIHKSKGKESDTVFLIETFDGTKLIPSRYAITPDQKLQETNLLFVARTRAKVKFVQVQLKG